MSEDNLASLITGEHNTVEQETSEAVQDETTEQHEEEVSNEEPLEETQEATHEETVEPEAQTAEDEDDVKPHVPLPTFLGMKDKYRDEKAERIAAQEREAALKQQLSEYQKQAQVTQTPDPYQDPKGYTDYRFKELERQRVNDKILLSGEVAKRTHGEDVVAEAANWAGARAAKDPSFDAQVASQPDPMEWVIQQHRAARQLEEFQRDPEALFLRMAQEKGWLAQPAEQASAISPTAKSEKRIPKSLTDVTSSKGRDPENSQSPAERLKSLFD